MTAAVLVLSPVRVKWPFISFRQRLHVALYLFRYGNSQLGCDISDLLLMVVLLVHVLRVFARVSPILFASYPRKVFFT